MGFIQMIDTSNDTARAPLVSVAMSVYDGDRPEWLIRALDSVLEQSYTAIEFVVVSDGISKGDLTDVIKEYAARDARVKPVLLPRNGGLAKALNRAISVSTGEFIVRMDADDISPPERIEHLVDFMLKHSEVDAAGSYIAEFSDEAKIGKGNVISYPLVHDEMKACFLRRNPLAHASVVFRRRFFEVAGNYPLFSVTNEDTLLWLNGFKAGCRFANLPESLYFVRHDRANASRRVGFRKAFSDFVDRLRIIIDLNGETSDYLAASARLLLQIMPRSLYLAVRSLLLHEK